MRIFATLLMVIGIITCLASFGVSTTQYASPDSPLGPLGVISFAGQHDQLMTMLAGGFMTLTGAVLYCGEEIRTVLVRMLKK